MHQILFLASVHLSLSPFVRGVKIYSLTPVCVLAGVWH